METQVVSHPLVADSLRRLRDTDTDMAGFRRAMDSIGTMICYEAFRDLTVEDVPVETPVTSTTGARLTGSALIVPVLRAGLGLLDPATRLLPTAQVGFVGLVRDEDTHQPDTYLCSLPRDLSDRQVFLLDPMLATAGSALAAIEEVAERGARSVTLVCVLCAPEGVQALEQAACEVTLVTGAVDDHLTENAFISPGLGDAGDRLFGPR